MRKRIAVAVADIPRLRERVAPVLGRLAPPVWIPDAEFDLDFHFRRVALPSPGTDRAAVRPVHEAPAGTVRPDASVVALRGHRRTRGRHGARSSRSCTTRSPTARARVRLAEHYMDLEREAPPPPDVDLDAVIAKHTEDDDDRDERRVRRRR